MSQGCFQRESALRLTSQESSGARCPPAGLMAPVAGVTCLNPGSVTDWAVREKWGQLVIVWQIIFWGGGWWCGS